MSKQFIPTPSAINKAVEQLRSLGYTNARDVIPGILKYDYIKRPVPTHTGPLHIVLNRDETKIGVVINECAHPCPMEGCTGTRKSVRWQDGRLTYPCTKGLECVAENIDKIM